MASKDLKDRAATIAAGICANPEVSKEQLHPDTIASIALRIAQQIEDYVHGRPVVPTESKVTLVKSPRTENVDPDQEVARGTALALG